MSASSRVDPFMTPEPCGHNYLGSTYSAAVAELPARRTNQGLWTSRWSSGSPGERIGIPLGTTDLGFYG